MHSLFAYIRRIVISGFQPPVGSSPSDIRKGGMKLALLGLVVLALGIAVTIGASMLLPKLAHINAWFAETDAAVKVALPVFFAGFAAIVVGGYRAAFGTDPMSDGRSSALRIAVGVGFGCGSLVLLLIVAIGGRLLNLVRTSH